MGAGNPVQIGNCVKELVNKYSNGFVESNLSETIVHSYHQQKGHVRRATSHSQPPVQRRRLDTNTQGMNMQENVSLFIASDNSASSQQINSTANLPMSVVSPKGCHVELDPSFDCRLGLDCCPRCTNTHSLVAIYWLNFSFIYFNPPLPICCSKLTISYWLVLAASDVIVTQTDLTGSPISAFSRYAAVYGLKGDSLRDARNCSNVQALYDISRRWTGNWFCD